MTHWGPGSPVEAKSMGLGRMVLIVRSAEPPIFGVFSDPGGDDGAGVRGSVLADGTLLWRELWC